MFKRSVQKSSLVAIVSRITTVPTARGTRRTSTIILELSNTLRNCLVRLSKTQLGGLEKQSTSSPYHHLLSTGFLKTYLERSMYQLYFSDLHKFLKDVPKC